MRRSMNDLVSLMALPAMWASGDHSNVVGTLLEVLLGMLGLDLVYVLLTGSNGDVSDMVRLTQALAGTLQPEEVGRALIGSLGSDVSHWPSAGRVSIGAGEFSIASVPMGLQAEIGIIVAGSRRPDFAGETERLLLSVAANQAALALHEARLLDEQRRLAADLDQRVAQRTAELAQANEALRESEERTRLIVDSIPGGIAIFAPDGQLEGANLQLLEYFGKPFEDVKRWATSDITHPDDLPGLTKTFEEMIASGQPGSFTTRLRGSDGAFRWFVSRVLPLRDASGRIARWYGLMTDIDDRKQAEEALAASQRNLQVTVDTIPALAWSARTDGTADFFNRHYLDYVGRSIDEMAGWAWTSVVHPDDLPQLDPVWQKARETNGSAEWEARLRGADGKYRWFIFRANPLRDETGKVVKWYGINTDIEGRKRAEEALSELRTELAHVSRVSTLGAMTASIAHEVNQPLSGIITNASTCLRMLDGDPPNIDGARETSRRTIRDGNRAAEIVARLRALFSKKGEATDPVDLSEAARDVIALCASELRRSSG